MKKIEITDETSSVLIGVYGTLRENCGNHYLLGNSKYLGTYKTESIFSMFGKNAGFPIVSPEGKTSITYELYKVIDPEILYNLHSLEGFTGVIDNPRNWYNMIELQNEDFGTIYMYVQNMESEYNSRWNSNLIETGDWLNQEVVEAV